MANNQDFVITGALAEYTGPGGDVVIPELVTKIDNGAFQNCTSLASVTIPKSVTEIGSYAFAGCTGLTSITIPESVTEIGSYAFADCTNLTSVTIPKNIIQIGFRIGLTSATIWENTVIGDDAFKNCPELTIYAPAGSEAEQYARENGIKFEAL